MVPEELVLKLIGELSLLLGRAVFFRAAWRRFLPREQYFAFFALSQSGDEFQELHYFSKVGETAERQSKN
jgi:hypothetical protein